MTYATEDALAKRARDHTRTLMGIARPAVDTAKKAVLGIFVVSALVLTVVSATSLSQPANPTSTQALLDKIAKEEGMIIEFRIPVIESTVLNGIRKETVIKAPANMVRLVVGGRTNYIVHDLEPVNDGSDFMARTFVFRSIFDMRKFISQPHWELDLRE